MGTKVIHVRLPDDHWIFQKKNKSEVVREALKLYRQLSGELTELNQSVQEIKEMIGSGTIIQEPEQKKLDADPRLMKVLDDFL